ncbi:MAG: hypothetical protein GXY65_03490 [Rhodococcus sp.]|uniref:hypothetical protein n=1 Tax=Rhodococcus TaxID=1827 RepID=UPI00169B6CC3|nr:MULTISPECIES: hypothetical protein [Rhodococcus]NLV78402.1 hypothetical protein [Rhodococcus sp. (in: high G+C Gram-positive bacteria)]
MTSMLVSGRLGILGVTVLGLAACGGGTVTVVADSPVDSGFEDVFVSGQESTVGEVARSAGVDPGTWDRMYYFSVPILESEVNSVLGTSGTTWSGLPGAGADGLVVFMSGSDVVYAAVADDVPLSLTGYATAESKVGPEQQIQDYHRVVVESAGR